MKPILNKASGFSLVELSIVLVILGLLVGGVITGQNLIRASEIRSITKDVQMYVAAVQTFRSKYNALPGDMTNATEYWGAEDGGDGLGTDCTNVASTGTATCNGDGNAKIRTQEDSNTVYETYRVWQHLSNAGLIPGGYTGREAIVGVGGPDIAIGTNIPASKISGAGYFLYWANEGYSDTNLWPARYRNVIVFGKDAFPSFATGKPAIKPEEAWNIDTKIDDGLPALGKVLSFKAGGFNPSCTTSDLTDAAYLLTSSSIACGLMFITGF